MLGLGRFFFLVNKKVRLKKMQQKQKAKQQQHRQQQVPQQEQLPAVDAQVRYLTQLKL